MKQDLTLQASEQITRQVANEVSQWMNEIIFLIPNWKWIGAATGLLLGFLVRSVAKHAIHYIKTRPIKRTKLPTLFNHFLERDVHLPLSWLIAVGVWNLSLEILSFHQSFEKFISTIIHLLALVSILRLVYMAVEATGITLDHRVKNSKNSLDTQLAPFATKVLKIVVITFGALLSLQSLGFNVGAVLAGLGIGSLALALAAQDTAANLFGSITIILDRPFQVNDYIKIADTEGSVEEVVFRSTRIRTPNKSVITIPNSTMAKEKIENLGARPARRVRHIIGIASWTPAQKIEPFINEIRHYLSSDSMILKDEVTVNFQAIGDFDYKIQVNCYVNTTDVDIELETQQEILLKIIEIAARNQIELPYPTRTVFTRQI